MADLMKTFMFSQDRPFILYLIQEIPNFKSCVNGYLNDGPNILVDHMKMHLFQFFVDRVRWPVMQYKVSPINALWALKMARPYDCGRRMAQDGQNCWWGFQILFHFARYGEMMN